MNLVERIKRVCLSPKTEWPAIADEPAETSSLITGYVLPLAIASAVAGFIGGSIVGTTALFTGTYRVPITAGLVGAVMAIALSVAFVFVLSLIINALAPTFGAPKDSARSLKVAVYSMTPAFVAGVLQIIPALAVLGILGGLYGIYLMYLGLPRVMRCAEDKAPAYTAVVVVCAFVVGVIGVSIGAAVVGTGRAGAGLMSSLTGGGETATGDAAVAPNSTLGRLAASLEESGKKIDAAEKSGDQGAQVAAALEGIGALLGGGSRVEPMAIERLKTFVPETFAGLPRQSSSAEKTGLGVTVSRAEAKYGDGARQVTLEVVDSGGVSGLLGFASWMGVQEEKEDENGYERTQKVDGRFVHERVSKQGGSNEFGIVLGDRFLVSAEGRGLSIDELKAAVSSLDLAALESLKNEGVAAR
jgi:hypothetical protein